MSISTLFRQLRGTAFAGLMDTERRAMQMRLARTALLLDNPLNRYALLRWYYSNNGLYDRLAQANYQAGVVSAAMRGLRNPAYRIVEFYPAHLWPGDLPAALPLLFPQANRSRADALTAAIQQVWQWSNWAQDKQTFARWLPMLGDVFLKVASPANSGRVYFELLDPAYVTDFDVDDRHNVVWARIDIPRERRTAAGEVERYTHVEVWSKADGTYKRWELAGGTAPTVAASNALPNPDEVRTLAELGIDFVPIVHCKFLDGGELRGVGAYLLQLDKIDALNAEATRLSQQLFRHNRATMAIMANANDATGRPLPAPELTSEAVGEDDDILYLPGMAKAEQLVPQLNYDAHRAWVLDSLNDLQTDCPELGYWRITEIASARDMSSLAIRAIMRPAIARLLEVRGRAEDALARADMMALSIGQAAGLPGFRGLGSYDAGDFEHTFEPREVVPLTDKEAADTQLVEWQVAQAQAALGIPHRQILRERGYTDQQIDDMRQLAATEDVIPVTGQ